MDDRYVDQIFLVFMCTYKTANSLMHLNTQLYVGKVFYDTAWIQTANIKNLGSKVLGIKRF